MESPLEVSSYVCDELNESNGKTEKSYYIQGVFSTIGVKNRNGRVYSRHLWEKEVARYQDELRNKTINTLGEYNHPPRSEIDPMKAVIRITELKIDGNHVFGKAKILNNNSPETEQLKALIKEGMKIGISSRGVGSVNEQGVVQSFKLITYDVVPNPSDYNANLDGLTEGALLENGIVKNIEYSLNESGQIQQKKFTDYEQYKIRQGLEALIKGL